MPTNLSFSLSLSLYIYIYICKGESKGLQYSIIWHMIGEGDETHLTVRYWARLILSKCYLLCLPLWLGADLRIHTFRPTRPCFIVEVLATWEKFLQSSGLTAPFTLESMNVSGCVRGVKAQFKHVSHKLHCTFICEAFESYRKWFNESVYQIPLQVIASVILYMQHKLAWNKILLNFWLTLVYSVCVNELILSFLLFIHWFGSVWFGFMAYQPL